MPVISSSTSSSDVTERTILLTELGIFNGFAILSLVLNAAVLASALWSPYVHRRRLWYNLLISWSIYSFSYLLIIRYQLGPVPPHGLCVAQAALIYASPPLCAISHMCLVIDYHLLASALVFNKKAPNEWASGVLLACPWIVFGVMTYTALLLIGDPSVVLRNPNHLYCYIKTPAPFMTSAAVIFFAAAVVLSVEAYTAVILYRYWGFRPSRSNNANFSLSMFVRLSIFTAMVLVAAALDMAAVSSVGRNLSGLAIVLTIIPTLAALMFGTQRDILSACMVCRRRPANRDPSPDALDHTIPEGDTRKDLRHSQAADKLNTSEYCC